MLPRWIDQLPVVEASTLAEKALLESAVDASKLAAAPEYIPSIFTDPLFWSVPTFLGQGVDDPDDAWMAVAHSVLAGCPFGPLAVRPALPITPQNRVVPRREFHVAP